MSKTKECPFCKEQIKADAIKCKHCGSNIPDEEKEAEKRRKNHNLKVALVLLILVPVFLPMMISSFWQGFTEGLNENESDTAAVNEEFDLNGLSDREVINELANNDTFEVSIWDTDIASMPYEVIVNTSPGTFASCAAAKNALYETMRGIYTNEQLRGKVARVLFTGYGYLRVSLGADDAYASSGANLERSGPSNFWTVLQEYKPYEDESGELPSRTWSVNINC